LKNLLKYFIFLLLALILGASSFLRIYIDLQLHLKNNISRCLLQNEHNYSSLHMDVGSFNKLHSGNEIWYEGKLYDMEHILISGDSVIINVLQDNDEAEAIKELAAVFEVAAPDINDGKPHLFRIIHHSGTDAATIPPLPLQKNCRLASCTLRYKGTDNKFISRIIPITAPPPKASV
jgi:hypothetical protein